VKSQQAQKRKSEKAVSGRSSPTLYQKSITEAQQHAMLQTLGVKLSFVDVYRLIPMDREGMMK
jgi:hypothetical protein